MEGYASLCYKNLKRNEVREAKSKMSKLKKYMDKRFLSSFYKKDLYIKITSLK